MDSTFTHSVFWLRRPRLSQLQALREAQQVEQPTYPEVGATRGEETPAGYQAIRHRAGLGQGAEVFQRAAAALREWAPQRGAGMTVVPPPVLEAGETVVVALPVFPLWTTVAGRIVYVVDAPERVGFAYGTLPHHPERGEEYFGVERDAAGEVFFVVRAFSRPVHPLARLGAPLTLAVQRLATRRYIRAMRQAAEQSP